jgi:hypothetical protein
VSGFYDIMAQNLRAAQEAWAWNIQPFKQSTSVVSMAGLIARAWAARDHHSGH